MAGIDGRFLGKRLSRRGVLKGATGAALGAAGVGLLACGSSEEGGPGPGVTASPGAEGQVKRGGLLRMVQGDPFPTLHPFLPGLASLAQGLFLGYTVYDHLWFTPTDTGIRELFLATSIEQPDELTIIVEMGESFFHDKPPVSGRKVLAQDVKATQERYKEVPPTGFSWVHHVLDKVETPNDRTVIFHLSQPWAWTYTSSNAGSAQGGSIMPEEVLHDDEFLGKDAIGSGHWMLDGHDHGANVRLRSHPRWREPGRPYLDGIDFKTITEPAAAQAALLAQDVDLFLGFPSQMDAEAARDQSGGHIKLSTGLAAVYRTLMLKWKEPFLDERVRHGINLALNRQEMIDLIDLGEGQMAGPVPPVHRRYALDDSELEEYFRHDPAEAKKLLEAAVFPFDQEIELKFASTEDSSQMAQILEQQLGEVGIKLKLTSQDLLTVWLPKTLGQGGFEMTNFTHLGYEDPDLPLRFYLSAEALRGNYMDYKDEDVDRAVLAAAREMDDEKRVELTKEAQRVIMRKWAPMLNLYSPIGSFGAWDYVKNTVLGRGSYGLFVTDLWLDK